MPVALITDYGVSGWYSGVLKGTIGTLFPEAHIIDITHQVPRGDLRNAAFTLAAVVNSFPEKTVFCVAVDPGVRSDRRILVAPMDNRTVVAPDNGVISWAFRNAGSVTVWAVDVRMLQPYISRYGAVLHDDPFGCIAALVASGVSPVNIGTSVTDWQKLTFPETVVTKEAIITEIIAIDPFGNCITAADASLLGRNERSVQLTIGTITRDAVVADHYDQTASGTILVYPGSTGYVEIAMSSGSAADCFSAKRSTPVEILFREKRT